MYLLTLLAFYFHQIFELTDGAFQACRKKLRSKQYMWESLRSAMRELVFDSWELLKALKKVLKISVILI